MIEINGKTYPLWSQFVERKDEWIGGVLEDKGDSLDRALGSESGSTEIVDIELRANGDESALFSIVGKDFSCAFDVQSGGVTAGEDGWLTFCGYGGHVFRIKKKE